MADYVVRSGDCFTSIAARWGLTPQHLMTLGNNSRHAEGGRSPHQLRPGDVIEVPDEPPNRSTSFSSGGSKTYRVKIPKVRFRTRLLGRDGVAWANKRYELVVHYQTYEGRTDDKGWVEQKIPATAMEADLFVWLKDSDEEPWELRIALGGMQPHAEDSGIAQRLANLGYGIALRGTEGLVSALRSFQRDQHLPASGMLDNDTLRRLETIRRGQEES